MLGVGNKVNLCVTNLDGIYATCVFNVIRLFFTEDKQLCFASGKLYLVLGTV